MMAVVSVAYLLHYGLKVDDWTKFIFHFIRLGTKLNFYWFRKLLENINIMYNIIVHSLIHFICYVDRDFYNLSKHKLKTNLVRHVSALGSRQSLDW